MSQGSSPKSVTDDGGGFGRFFPGSVRECTERCIFLKDQGRWRALTEILLLDLLTWGPGSQPAHLVSIQKEALGQLLRCSFLVRELCPLVSAEALDCFSSSISSDQGLINARLPFLLCHPRIEVMCAQSMACKLVSWVCSACGSLK